MWIAGIKYRWGKMESVAQDRAGWKKWTIPQLKRLTVASRAFPVVGPKTWNAVPKDVTSSQSEYTFRLQLKTWLFKKSFRGGSKEEGEGRPRLPFKSLAPYVAPKSSVKWLHCAMSVLVTSLCHAFSGADIEFDFVLMSSAYSRYLKDSCKQHLADYYEPCCPAHNVYFVLFCSTLHVRWAN